MLADFVQGLLSPRKQGPGVRGAEGFGTDPKSLQGNLGVPHLLRTAVRSRHTCFRAKWEQRRNRGHKVEEVAWPSPATYISVNNPTVK